MAGTVGEDKEVNLAIIITPFLDMSFQLFAFFVMFYQPSNLEGHIDGNLMPPAKVALKGPPGMKQEKKDDEVITDQEPDPKETVIVRIKAVARGQQEGRLNEGQPTRILLKKPEAADAELIADAASSDMTFDKALDKLAAALKKIQEGPGGAKTNINIEADRDLRHGYFVQVYDVCKAARFASIGFVPPPPESKGS